jgi:hypothetical protein
LKRNRLTLSAPLSSHPPRLQYYFLRPRARNPPLFGKCVGWPPYVPTMIFTKRNTVNIHWPPECSAKLFSNIAGGAVPQTVTADIVVFLERSCFRNCAKLFFCLKRSSCSCCRRCYCISGDVVLDPAAVGAVPVAGGAE